MCILIIIVLIIIIALVVTGYFLFIKKNNKEELSERFLGNLPNFSFRTDLSKQDDGEFYRNPGFESTLSQRHTGGMGLRSAVRNSPMADDKHQALPTCDMKNKTCKSGSKREIMFDESYINDSQEHIEQPVVYDRLMFSTKQSRLRQQGDQIRGDLPIIPNQDKNQWFIPAANPRQDLQEGALASIGGNDSENVRKMNNLMGRFSDGIEDQIRNGSGAPMINKYNIGLKTGNQDVIVTAYA